MKIIKLQAQNIKRIKAVEIKPDGNVIMLTGRNGAGKSSVLDSIVYAICGKEALPSKPIREGEESASVVVDLDGETKLKITRTFTETNSYLTVTNAEGFKATSPQAVLDKLIGKVSIFDPTKLMAMSPAEQRKMLLGLVGADFSAFDRKIVECREVRTRINSEKKTLEVNLVAVPQIEGVPAAEVDFAALTDELQAAQKNNAEITDRVGRLQSNKAGLEDDKKRLLAIQQKISQLTKEAGEVQGRIDGLVEVVRVQTESLDAIKPIDTNAIAQRIKDAQATNAKVRQNLKRNEIALKIADLSDKYAVLGNHIKEQEDGKAKLLAESKMPVEGLSADDNGLLYNGIPLQQASESEQLRVCVSIAMAMSPKLRVIRITGNGLDSDSMRIVADMAAAQDYQLWVEKVDESGQVGIVIEDGEVKGLTHATLPASV